MRNEKGPRAEAQGLTHDPKMKGKLASPSLACGDFLKTLIRGVTDGSPCAWLLSKVARDLLVSLGLSRGFLVFWRRGRSLLRSLGTSSDNEGGGNQSGRNELLHQLAKELSGQKAAA